MLHRGAQRVLDAAAVEAADRLELVERDGEPAAARRRRAGRAARTPPAPAATTSRRCGRRETTTREPRCRRGPVRRRTSARTASSSVAQPGRARGPSRVSTDDQRPGVALEERDVRAEAADGDLDGQRAAASRPRPAPGGRATTCRSGAARSGRPSGRPAGRRSAGRARPRGRRTPPPARPRRRRTGSCMRYVE